MNRSKPASWVKLLAGTAALSLALVACGSEDDEPEGSAEESPSASESASEPAAGEVTDDPCAASDTSANAFKVGGILPVTGNLAFLGPPEIAGVGLAVSDINAAGGVNGAQACHQIEDSGDTSDLAVSSNSADKLIQGQPSVVIGAASSSVTENVVQTFTDAKITEVSPANTATSLSGVSPFYFRTVVPDSVQGNALATLIAGDGYQKLAFLVFNDTYGTGLRNEIEKNFTANGGTCTYGCKGDGNEFPANQTTFSAEVSAALATNPDAIMILAFDETKAIIPELNNQNWDMSKVYLSDGNTSNYSEDLPPGSMEGAQGTVPGADAAPEVKEKLNAWNTLVNGEELNDFSYAAESYDAVILAALAAVRGGANDSVTVKDNYAAVSGAAEGAEECTSFEDCVALLEEDKEIKYSGPSGIGPLNEQNDPESGYVGIFAYDETNANSLSTTIEGVS
ncbi:ABC transporter substrate-binding protein [Nocardioides sp. SYSU D00038]|uniref:ABC transporter substrate-binding protein n=1 Tax=Nocardioides sp. SYSU D00038 TaxID=2812554 RepID=UPI0019681E5E|nr:ABC transporter substrate-binding protein [Nocardioides sp. SYSU D00038]